MKEKKMTTPSDRLMTAGEIANLLNVAVRNVGRWGRLGTYGFPPPIKLNNKTSRWRESDVNNWLRGIEDEQRKNLSEYGDAVHTTREEREQTQEPPRSICFVDELCGNITRVEPEEPSGS